jgi:rod shape-determining protein MreC
VKKRSIILGLIVVALIGVCFLLPTPFVDSLRKETMELLGPILRTAEKPIAFFNRLNAKLKTLDQAQAEVFKLDKEVAELQLRNQLLADKGAENARLREMLGYREASQYRLRACQVVSREPSSWWDSVQVNIGWEDEPGLTKDQPVVSPRGVVGKTGNVSRYVTDVILMVSENCSISATVENPAAANSPDAQKTPDHGIVQGQGNFEEGKPRVRIRYLPKNSQVTVGQFVVTSGLGPYFPAGLRLGTVTEVPALTKTYPTFGLYREAIIEPTADLNQLDELFVVLGSKQKADQPENGENSHSDANPP